MPQNTLDKQWRSILHEKNTIQSASHRKSAEVTWGACAPQAEWRRTVINDHLMD
jgi:hypothetical protein